MENTEQKTVEQTTTKGDLPKYKADGVAVWVNKTKDGEDYLSIKIVGHGYINAFLNKPKE